jgi:hypothetical protein
MKEENKAGWTSHYYNYYNRKPMGKSVVKVESHLREYWLSESPLYLSEVWN